MRRHRAKKIFLNEKVTKAIRIATKQLHRYQDTIVHRLFHGLFAAVPALTDPINLNSFPAIKEKHFKQCRSPIVRFTSTKGLPALAILLTPGGAPPLESPAKQTKTEHYRYLCNGVYGHHFFPADKKIINIWYRSPWNDEVWECPDPVSCSDLSGPRILKAIDFRDNIRKDVLDDFATLLEGKPLDYIDAKGTPFQVALADFTPCDSDR